MARLKGGAEYGGLKHPSSREQIERFSPEGVYMALYPWLRAGVSYVEDDFIEDTISTTRWNLAADGGASTFAWSVARNGTIQGDTGSVDDDAVAINGDSIWLGDQDAGMEVRFKLDVVTAFQLEIGFTDALSDETLPAVTDIDTPATGNGATDVAVLHLDTDQTLQTAELVGESTGSAFAAQKTASLLNGAGSAALWTPSAANYYTVRVQLNGDHAFVKVFDTNDASKHILKAEGGLRSLLDGGALVRPHCYFRTRNTTPKIVDIDYIRVWQNR